MKKLLAQKITNPAVGKFGTQEGTKTVSELLTNVFNMMIIVGAIILVIMIIFSGIEWATAGGDKDKVQRAQKRLTNVLIGFIILICVFAIANLVGSFFGLGWLQTFKFPVPTPE